MLIAAGVGVTGGALVFGRFLSGVAGIANLGASSWLTAVGKEFVLMGSVVPALVLELMLVRALRFLEAADALEVVEVDEAVDSDGITPFDTFAFKSAGVAVGN